MTSGRPNDRRSVLGRKQRAATTARTAAAGVIGQQLGRVLLVDHQAVVVVEFFAGFDFAQGADENPPARLVRFAIGRARMVDPTCIVATEKRIDHVFLADMEIKRVVRVVGVVGMAFLRFFPADDLAGVLDDDFAFGDGHQGKHPFAMDA